MTFELPCLTTLLALLFHTWRASPSYTWQGQFFFCPSAYPCCVFLLPLPSSRHQVEVACGVCHTATRAQTWQDVCLQSLHPQVLLVWKDTIQKSKMYVISTQPPSMPFSNPPFILRNRAEAQNETIFNYSALLEGGFQVVKGNRSLK